MTQELGEATLAAFSAYSEGVPGRMHVRRATLPPDPFRLSTGFKSPKAFARGAKYVAVAEKDGRTQIIPNCAAPKGGYSHHPGPSCFLFVECGRDRTLSSRPVVTLGLERRMTQIRHDMDSAEAIALRAIERIARESYGKLCAILSSRTGDLMRAEDALGDSLASALQHWPVSGVPTSPEGWLLTTARRKVTDLERHDVVHGAFMASLLADSTTRSVNPAAQADSGDCTLADPRLRLLFVCTHPALDAAIRTPLMLQTVLGFDAKRIAAAFLWSPSAMAQRLVRAKHKIRDTRIPFSASTVESLPERIDAVLRAVYAAYGHGWGDPSGMDAARRDFAEEAIWLGRTLLQLCPADGEVRGLLALMLYLESRRHARRNDAGDFVPLGDQPSERWDHSLIEEAEGLLDSARSFGRIGRFQLEAAIQSVHATRARSGTTDWRSIVRLYDALYMVLPSPVVAINRAVAIAETESAATALIALASVDDDVRIRTYQPYWAARAELLARTGDVSGAGAAYQQAIGLSEDPSVRRFLAGRRAMLMGA